MSTFTQFLLGQLPHCTHFVLKKYIKADTLAKLRKEYALNGQLDLTRDKCPNLTLCKLSVGTCPGRPVPKHPEVLQSLKRLNLEVIEGVFQGREVYYIESKISCGSCPFKSSCEAVCASVESYTNRTIDVANEPKHTLGYQYFEMGIAGRGIDEEEEYHQLSLEWFSKPIPWDCIPEETKTLIELRYYSNHTFGLISEITGLDEALIRKNISTGVRRLSEFAKARDVISKSSIKVPDYVQDYYLGNLDQLEISRKHQVSQAYVSKVISKWKNLSGLRKSNKSCLK